MFALLELLPLLGLFIVACAQLDGGGTLPDDLARQCSADTANGACAELEALEAEQDVVSSMRHELLQTRMGIMSKHNFESGVDLMPNMGHSAEIEFPANWTPISKPKNCHPYPHPSHRNTSAGCLSQEYSFESIKGYHQTSPHNCELILNSTFKLGSEGWCGGAVYFALTPEATITKSVGPYSKHGCMLEAKIALGQVLEFPCCALCDNRLDEDNLKEIGVDTVIFDPGDGVEVAVYNPSRISNIWEVPWQSTWWNQSLTCAHNRCHDEFRSDQPCQCGGDCLKHSLNGKPENDKLTCCFDYLDVCKGAPEYEAEHVDN